MREFISNPYFQLIFGATVSFLGSVAANQMYLGSVAKKRAQREAQRAYNRLTDRLVRTTVPDITDPLHVLPLDIADRVEDLKFAIADVDPRFDYMVQVKAAIEQAASKRLELETAKKAAGRT